MEALDFKNLFSIKGKPGVWKFKIRLVNGLIVFNSCGSDAYTVVKDSSCTAIGDQVVHTNEGNLPVERVIDWLFADSTNPDFVSDFDSLSPEEKKTFMEKYAPNYDSTRFKEQHMSRIFKWFKELHKFLDKVS